jgi:folate-binding protein YgfZ
MTPLVLHNFHAQLHARFTEVESMEVVKNYGDYLKEYSTLRRTAGILDLSYRGRLVLTGADRVRFLNGQVTNNVQGLLVGQGCYSALVTNKGRMESDLNIYILPEEILLDFEPGLSNALSKRLNGYIIADDVQVIDVSPHYGLISIHGPESEAILARTELGLPLPETEFLWGSINHQIHGEIYVMNRRRVGLRGFDLFVPTDGLLGIARRLNAVAIQVGGGPCGRDAFETVRMEAGIPRIGAEMNERILPLEAGIESRAISYTKGCYIGQEIIARIRTYGQVAKALRGLRFDDDFTTLPASGDKVFFGDKEVGYVCSAKHSPTLNARIALAYVRREYNQIATDLRVRTNAGELRATIVTLPFVPHES